MNIISASVILFVSFSFINLHLVPNINVGIAAILQFLSMYFWTSGGLKLTLQLEMSVPNFFSFHMVKIGSQDSAVDIATGYGLEVRGESWILHGVPRVDKGCGALV
jgi:hypothetical protein